MRLLAFNFLPKKGGHPIDEVDGFNICSKLCGDPEYEDTAYFSPRAYLNIFCKTRTKVCRCKKRLSVVRITNPEKGVSIYRKYEYSPRFEGIGDNDVVLNPASIRELAGGEDNSSIVGKEVCVRPGCRLAYYWNHPFHATRISTKLGCFSILLTIVSFVIGLVSLFCSCCG